MSDGDLTSSLPSVREEPAPQSPPILTIDFESYFDRRKATAYSLSTMTTEEYIMDSRWETLGVGVLENGKEPSKWPAWMEHAEFQEYVQWVESAWGWDNVATVSHHAHFDMRVLGFHYGAYPGFIFDTLSMASPFFGPDASKKLGVIMPKLGLGEKGDELNNAMGKRRHQFSQAEWLRLGEYCKQDCRGEWGAFQAMLPIFPEDELRLIDMCIRMFTEPVFVLDEPAMERALAAELERKRVLMRKISDETSIVKKYLMSNDKFAQMLMELGVDPPMKWSAKKKCETYAFAKSDPWMQEAAEEDSEIGDLVRARIGVKSTIAETRAGRFLRAGAGGRSLPVYLKIYGAHTFRYSGGDKMNWQNLQKPDEDKPELGELRRAIRAPEGCEVVAADSAQIEARKIAWLAGQEDVLDAFRNKRDVYSEAATVFYGRQITKENKTERFIGKTCTLGLGYQMGFLKFSQQLSVGMLGGDPVVFGHKEADIMGVNVAKFEADSHKPFGVGPTRMERIEAMPSRLPLDKRIVHCAVADHIVKQYRKKNDKIVEFWGFCEQLLMAMVEGEEYEFKDEVTGELVFKTGRHSLTLASGLTMKYPDLKATLDEEGRPRYSVFNLRYKTREGIYGGKLAENITQALSRVIVTTQMLAAQDAGMKIATMTHDEIVTVVPKQDAERRLVELVTIMRQAPKWCHDLPLDAEGGHGPAYGLLKKGKV